MARPIAPTPALRGEEAKKFIEAAKNPKPFAPPIIDNAKAVEEIKRRFLAREQESV